MEKIKIKKLDENAVLPFYAKKGDAGVDFSSIKRYLIKPGERCLIETGLAFEIPEGYELQIRPRSGLALKKGISIVNSPGTIDSGYRGELGIILINHGEEDFEINLGDKIAQGVFNKIENAQFEEVYELSKSDRGSGGFGHTG
ncbi:MAG TPA: dUTP diphosphatase [Candidatus Paceibacterota bacterium]|nr:dUTP diphosphatase [Candidatus Paceibacterota bacterium]